MMLALNMLTPACIRALGPGIGSDGAPGDTAKAPRWVSLEGSASQPGATGRVDRATNICIASDQGAGLYLAWSDALSGNREIYLRHWYGTGWRDLGSSGAGGGISQIHGDSRLGSLIVDFAGNPHLAWMVRRDDPPSKAIYYRQWTGEAWSPLGDSTTGSGLSAGGNAYWPALTLNVQKHPVVAWEEYNVTPSGGAVVIKAWDGQGWSSLTGANQGDVVSGEEQDAKLVSLATSDSGAVHAIWEDHGQTPGVRHRLLESGSWRELPGTDGLVASAQPPKSNFMYPKLQLLPGGGAAVAWTALAATGNTIQVASWQGASWQQIGQWIPPGGAVTSTALAAESSSRIFMAWSSEDSLGRNIYVNVWDGAEWISLSEDDPAGGVSRSGEKSTFPQLALGPPGLFLAWEEEMGPDHVVVFLKLLPRSAFPPAR